MTFIHQQLLGSSRSTTLRFHSRLPKSHSSRADPIKKLIMKLSQIIFIGSAIASASSRPLQNLRRQDDSFDGLSFDQIDALTPQFGHEADVNPTGTGDCDGAVNDASGNPVKVPCDCPPDRTAFIQVSTCFIRFGRPNCSSFLRRECIYKSSSRRHAPKYIFRLIPIGSRSI